ncbi:hypothetical protein Tco_1157615 [Tanacetum coccineum]
MDKVMRLVIEVGREEKAVEEAKEEAIKSAFDTLVKMDECKRAQWNAKETNDMKVDLATEREVVAHTLDDGDRSLEVLEESKKLKEEALEIHKELLVDRGDVSNMLQRSHWNMEGDYTEAKLKMGREPFSTLRKRRILTTAARPYGSTTTKAQNQDDWFATLAPKVYLSVKPQMTVTANEQPNVEATHKDEAMDLIVFCIQGLSKFTASMDGRISPVRSVVTSLNKLMLKELTGGIANCTNTPNSAKGFASSESESSSSGSGKRTIIDLDNYND